MSYCITWRNTLLTTIRFSDQICFTDVGFSRLSLCNNAACIRLTHLVISYYENCTVAIFSINNCFLEIFSISRLNNKMKINWINVRIDDNYNDMKHIAWHVHWNIVCHTETKMLRQSKIQITVSKVYNDQTSNAIVIKLMSDS